MQAIDALRLVVQGQAGHYHRDVGLGREPRVELFAHGLRGSRVQMLPMADTAAAAGYAVITIDAPLHGIRPEDETFAALYIENTPFADVANERTFDADYIDNATGAPGPDGITDPSGIHITNLASLVTTRDNWRQAQADWSILAVSVPSISIDGDALPDLDGSNIQFAALSGASVLGPAFVATEPMVTNAFLSVPMGGVARGLEASPTYGPAIRAGLKAAAGIEPGMAEYELFLTAWQTLVDSADPINWAGEAARFNNIVVHEVIGDTDVPNFVFPLSGTEPMIAAMGLTSYSSTQVNPGGVDLVGRFVPPAVHGSLLDPTASPAATIEMQKQLASFLVSNGTAVVVEDPSVMVPVPAAEKDETASPKDTPKLGLEMD